jgi:hypothetical protein
MRVLRPVAASVLAVAALLLAVPGAAMARGAQPTAQVRVAHLSPDASYVDIYAVSLNRDQVFPNVFYKAVSTYWGVAAGRFTYEVRPAGTDPGARPAVSVTGRLQPGGDYSVAVVGPKSNLRGVLLRDDLSPVARGKARVRFVDTFVDRRPVDVLSGGKVLAKGLRLGAASGYLELAPGRYKLQVRPSGGTGSLYRGAFTLRAGTVTSAILTGGAGQPNELLPVDDAAGARTMPTTSAGIATGAGGTARPDDGSGPWTRALPAALVVVALGAMGGVALRGTRRRSAVAMLLAVPLLAGCVAGSAGATATGPAPASPLAAAPATPAATAPVGPATQPAAAASRRSWRRARSPRGCSCRGAPRRRSRSASRPSGCAPGWCRSGWTPAARSRCRRTSPGPAGTRAGRCPASRARR